MQLEVFAAAAQRKWLMRSQRWPYPGTLVDLCLLACGSTQELTWVFVGAIVGFGAVEHEVHVLIL